MTPTHLTDGQLLARVKKHCATDARRLASLLTDLIDIEDRRIHLRDACSSMYDFCKRKFGMSPSESWRRTTAARLVRRVPVLLEYVRRGDVDLSTLVLLRNFIDTENAADLIRATRCRSKRQIQRLLELRQPLTGAKSGPRTVRSSRQDALLERLDEIGDELHLLEVAIRNKTRVLIERARNLLADTLPDATLADLVHRAFETLVDSLEDALAKARAKRGPRPPVKAGYVPRAVRQAVFLRDGFQCTYVSARGERCRATRYLEVDHIVARALGGTDDVENLRCACRAHNQHFAEQRFGKQFVQNRIRTRQHRPTTGARAAAART